VRGLTENRQGRRAQSRAALFPQVLRIAQEYVHTQVDNPVPPCEIGLETYARRIGLRAGGRGSHGAAARPGRSTPAGGRRCLRAAQEVGGVALLIDAKNEPVANWYASYGALRLLDAPLTLLLPLATIKTALEAARKL